MLFDHIVARASVAIKALFGSRARGDADENSDYDIAVFLNGTFDRWAENNRLPPLTVDFLTPENNYSII